MVKWSQPKVLLTSEEFASLKEVGIGRMQHNIPDEHRDRLIALGYIREVVRVGTGRALVLRVNGIRRLKSGK
jgi:hypothetical protein